MSGRQDHTATWPVNADLAHEPAVHLRAGQAHVPERAGTHVLVAVFAGHSGPPAGEAAHTVAHLYETLQRKRRKRNHK